MLFLQLQMADDHWTKKKKKIKRQIKKFNNVSHFKGNGSQNWSGVMNILSFTLFLSFFLSLSPLSALSLPLYWSLEHKGGQ